MALGGRKIPSVTSVADRIKSAVWEISRKKLQCQLDDKIDEFFSLAARRSTQVDLDLLLIVFYFQRTKDLF